MLCIVEAEPRSQRYEYSRRHCHTVAAAVKSSGAFQVINRAYIEYKHLLSRLCLIKREKFSGDDDLTRRLSSILKWTCPTNSIMLRSDDSWTKSIMLRSDDGWTKFKTPRQNKPKNRSKSLISSSHSPLLTRQVLNPASRHPRGNLIPWLQSLAAPRLYNI